MIYLTVQNIFHETKIATLPDKSTSYLFIWIFNHVPELCKSVTFATILLPITSVGDINSLLQIVHLLFQRFFNDLFHNSKLEIDIIGNHDFPNYLFDQGKKIPSTDMGPQTLNGISYLNIRLIPESINIKMFVT